MNDLTPGVAVNWKLCLAAKAHLVSQCLEYLSPGLGKKKWRLTAANSHIK
jgi:hypothetical protein